MKWSLLFLLILLPSCSQEPVSINNEMPEQTNVALPQVSAVPIQPRKLSKGEALYIRNCADCHGWAGRGRGPAEEYVDTPIPVLQNSQLLAEKSEQQFIDWVLFGSSSKLPLADKAGPQTDAEVTSLLVYMRRLPTIDWEKTGSGQEIYDELCAACHGLYGHGDGDFATQMSVPIPDLSTENYQHQHSDAQLLQIISQGKDAMPGVENVLSPAEIKSVIAFIRLFSPGYESYDRLCASCHSTDGLPMEFITSNEEQQYIEFENIAIPAFDSAYFQRHTDDQLTPKVQHMLQNNRVTMFHFAEDMQSDEIRQIYRYLRSLQGK